MKICGIVCDKYRKFRIPKRSYILKKTLCLSIICSNCRNEHKKIKEESIVILKMFGLITNTEEYQSIYNHNWIKHKSRTYFEQYRWNKKLFD